MSAALLPVWSEIEKYFSIGISVIPVRDKDDEFGLAKTPYKSWKKNQFDIISKDELFNLMDVKYNTTAVAMVCGAVSQNLEIIDIDVKYKPGIDAKLFTDLKELYPDLYTKLRIHKTPSGGFHLVYRCQSAVDGNLKLAGREQTKEELDEIIKKTNNPKPPKTVNFIETRGEGGYALTPPALGYSVLKDVAIPIFTAEERASIINLCRSYNELIKVEAPPRPKNNKVDEYYDENPFNDFNNRVDPTALIESFGYSYYKHNSNFIWYTRPGKDKGVSISFNQSKRFFFNFTASTDLDEQKGYAPSNLVALLKFNGDKKKLYQWLISQGYGKIKKSVEDRLTRMAATNGSKLPANASKEAIENFTKIAKLINETHPFGIYWADTSKGVVIDRENLYNVAGGLGFRLYKGKVVRVQDRMVEMVDERSFYDVIKSYIKEEDADLYRDICNSYEAFIEKHGKFTISRLQILPDDDIIKDTKDKAYKFYQNGILEINAQGYQLLSYESCNGLIWKQGIQHRSFKKTELIEGLYIDFLNKALGCNVLDSDYLQTCLGFLSHGYKDSATAYIIALTEQCENPKDGGGSGKNIFAELLKWTTTYNSKPGDQVKYDEKFLQSWNGEKVFCLSDVPKNFKFSFLRELSSGRGLVKKLYKDEAQVDIEDMPRFLITSNYSVEITDGGVKRRVKMIEFTDFFTKAEGVDSHYDKYFPTGTKPEDSDWDENDWYGYDNFIATCLQSYLKANRKIAKTKISAGGWRKQFEQTYGQTITNFIKDKWIGWTMAEWISNEDFKKQLETYYIENNISKIYQPSTYRINEALSAYAQNRNYIYIQDDQKSIQNCKVRGKSFLEEAPF